MGKYRYCDFCGMEWVRQEWVTTYFEYFPQTLGSMGWTSLSGVWGYYSIWIVTYTIRV
jgi:hypothetical protein